jgi:hypothetical protein
MGYWFIYYNYSHVQNLPTYSLSIPLHYSNFLTDLRNRLLLLIINGLMFGLLDGLLYLLRLISLHLLSHRYHCLKY